MAKKKKAGTPAGPAKAKASTPKRKVSAASGIATVTLPDAPIDAEEFRSCRERDLLGQIEDDANIMEFRAELEAERNPTALRRGLLRSALKLTRQTAPDQVALIDTVKGIVQLDMDIELYVEAGERLCAWCAPSKDGGAAFVGVSSAVIERLPLEELLFILGHELGHLRFGHQRFPISLMLDRGHGRLSTLEVFRLLAWSREAEISADRIGLLCCQNLETASRTFFRLTSGVTSDALNFSVPDYLKQLEEIRSLDDIDDTSDDWYSTHPFNPLRLKALELFARTDTFHAIAARGANDLTMESMEQSLGEFLSIMNPSYLADTDEETGAQIKEFVTLGAIFVALINGELESSEVEQIMSIVGAEAFAEKIDPIFQQGPQATWNELAGKAEAVVIKVIPAMRLQMVRDLVIVAIADGTIDASEFEALVHIADLLGISPGFVEMVANELRVTLEEEKGAALGSRSDEPATFAPQPTM